MLKYIGCGMKGIIDIVEDYDESVHGPFPTHKGRVPRKMNDLPRIEEAHTRKLPTVNEGQEGSLPAEGEVMDSDEELFQMMDRMAELEAQSETQGSNQIGESDCAHLTTVSSTFWVFGN